jgi:hypothetical protein
MPLCFEKNSMNPGALRQPPWLFSHQDGCPSELVFLAQRERDAVAQEVEFHLATVATDAQQV